MLTKAELLDALLAYTDATKLLSTFIPAMEAGWLKADGLRYVHGSFNIPGTVSGRLSSSEPNLQNLPSGKRNAFAKLIKRCFVAPEGFLFVGVDYPSLEDRISAKQTKDPKKIAVYTDGFDGHSMRTNYYFGLGIDPNDVDAVNRIEDDHPDLRTDSKPITFALTYMGTWKTLVKNCGLDPAFAQEVEKGFRELYKVSIEWVESRLVQASKDGYIDVAFGHRIRCPQLVGLDPINDRREFVQGMCRTLGNALGQSYGMLNSRSGVELRERLKESPYNYDIVPIAHIHDAQYFLTRSTPEVVHWLNINVVECNLWEDLDEIRMPEVPLGGNLEIFSPSWEDSIKVPNLATVDEISGIIDSLGNIE